MKRKNIHTLLLGALFFVGASLCSSCADDLEIGKQFDESTLDGIYENCAFLADGKSNKSINVVELYTEKYSTLVKMNLTKEITSSSSAKVLIDESYLATYNQLHGTDFEMFPGTLVALANNGVLQIANGKTKEMEVEVTITADDKLEAEKTYALPLAVVESSSDITIKDEESRHCVYLIKDMRKSGDVFKGEDVVKGFLFFEVNDVNPLNALSFQLENGKYLWDVVVLFAANINYDAEAGRPYVKCNPNVQYLLDNNETLLQPLRKRGIKVLLGILGNHDVAGVAQLSKQGAKDFARELAQYCKAYNLDGANFDDEYSTEPGPDDLDNPAITTHGREAAARLCYETKLVMPDKLVTVFDYGAMYGETIVDGVDVKNWIDIVVPNYGSAARPIGELTFKECAGMAIEFNLGIGSLGEYGAQSLIDQDYGWFMGFAPSPNKYESVFSKLSGVKTLYGSPLKAPSIFYKKNDPTPYRYPEDL